jgi:hypothetical protein
MPKKKFIRRRIAEVFLGGRLFKERKKKKSLTNPRTKQIEDRLRKSGLTEDEIKRLRGKKKK